MSTSPNNKKRPPSQRAGKPTARPKGKGKKKKINAWTTQIIAGGTLLLVGVIVAGAGVYMARRIAPQPQPTATPAPHVKVARPAIEATLENQAPTRPGLALYPEDEVYASRASDLPKDSPLEQRVTPLLSHGVLTVFADGKFRPNEPVPRAEFVTWLYNAVEAQTTPGDDHFVTPKKGFNTADVTGEEFRDVPSDHWAAPVLATVKKSGIFEAVLEKTFRPDAPLTREEWAGFAAYIAMAREARAKVPEEVDEVKLAVGLRKLNYNDPKALGDMYQWPVFAIVVDDKRKNWIGNMFEAPDNPGPWNPHKAVKRGEAALWLGEFYDQVGLGLM